MINLAFLSTAHIHTKGFIRAVEERDDCRVVAIWDENESRGLRYAAECEADFEGDLETVIARSDIDGFVICSENTRHLRLLKAAVPTGKPIFCEKPFMTSVADATEALALIREHGTVVHMGYFHPFSAPMQGVIAHVASGTLGAITHARYRNAHAAAYRRAFDSPDLAWFADPELAGGGAFMDMGAHAVHLVRTILGPVERVVAAIGNKSGIYPDVDDNGVALLQFESGCTTTVEASWIQSGGLDGIEIVGSDATLFNHPQRGYVTAAPREEPQPVAESEAKPVRIDRLVAVIGGEISADELESDLVCAADAVAIMEACYTSSDTGTWVDVSAV